MFRRNKIAEDKVDDVQALKGTLIDVIDSFLEILDFVYDTAEDREISTESQALAADLKKIRKKVVKQYGLN